MEKRDSQKLSVLSLREGLRHFCLSSFAVCKFLRIQMHMINEMIGDVHCKERVPKA
jgi:hypothetical protein